MKQKIQLNNITLIAVAGNKQAQTIAALYKCLNQAEFERVILITNIDIACSGIEVINAGGLKTWHEYNHFIVKELYKYFDTDYCLLVQWDGYILDANQWDDSFYEFDYIGAKWLDVGKPYNVGNGGFSWRSKRLQRILANDSNIITTCPEDTSICKVYGQYLMDNYGIKFADEETADKFAFELNQPLQPTFGFHSFHWQPYKETVVVKRDYAMGDVIMVEPILHYFYKKGYNVSLQSSPSFYNLFQQHYFPIVPREHINPNLAVREIDLNMAYEVKPSQNHLESYYEFAEVPKDERVMRSPMLSMNFNYKHPNYKLFPKYCVLHIDVRNEPHRNIYGIDWGYVVDDLNKNGYTVIQIGVGEHEEAEGAVQMRTPTESLLMWLIASSDLFMGIDSAPSHIASAFDIPSIIFFGSVDASIIHPNLKNKVIIENLNVCDTPKCWHNQVTETGVKCYVDEKHPPCTKFKNVQVSDAINKIIHDQNRTNTTGNN